MASYAEYPPHTMAYTSNDFTLFPPYDMDQEQQYLPTTYSQQTFLDPAAFDPTYQSQQAYAPSMHDQYAFNAENQAYLQAKHTTYRDPNSNYSPANSAVHSFEYPQPPVLSSTSDSGASGPSTISSAMGSPSMHPHASNEWSHPAMAVLPSIVAHDGTQPIFATTGYDLDSVPVTDKGCVGELSDISSSQQDETFPSVSMLDFPCSFRGDDLDFSSQDESTMWPPLDLSPVSSSALPFHASSMRSPPLATSDIMNITSPSNGVFEPAATPTSASSPTWPTSPVLQRVKGHRSSTMPSAPPLAKRARTSSPLTNSFSVDEVVASYQYPQAPSTAISYPPFFSQSSGTFVPPLESSCPSPSVSLFTLLQYVSSRKRSVLKKIGPLLTVYATDPSLIQPYSPTQYTGAQFPEVPAVHSPQNNMYPQVASPAPSSRAHRRSTGKASGSASPYMRTQTWQPYPANAGSRRQSVSSEHSRHSQGSISSDDSNKGMCPIASCGRHFKDLKAHMLTHQNERPEKCPIPICEYHIKGFARKYDKNRHTLTHYKGTMVCGFCPGSGSAAEKSFNRADVFKRHLTSVHGVEQTPPNARRKSPAGSVSKRPTYGTREASGMCSTCGVTFPNAQDFYEHLDDCVLRVVQQAEPSEAVNQKLLSSIADDEAVQETLEKNGLPMGLDCNGPTSFDEEEEGDDDEDAALAEYVDDADDVNDSSYGARSGRTARGATRTRRSTTTPS